MLYTRRNKVRGLLLLLLFSTLLRSLLLANIAGLSSCRACVLCVCNYTELFLGVCINKRTCALIIVPFALQP